jgi:hypothetical protein
VRACRCVCDRMVFSGPALRVRTPCVNVALARPREVCIDCGRKAGKRSVKTPGRTRRLRCCVLDFCGVRLEVFERSDSSGAAGSDVPSPGLVHLGFALGSADAVDELSGVLTAAGHRVLEPPHRTGELGSYESVVLDPDGNRLKLMV